MRRSSYPEGLKEFISEKYKTYTARQIVPFIKEEFGIEMTPEQVHNYIMNHGIKCGVRGKPMPECRKFSPEVDDFIHSNYKGRGYKVMADMVNSEFGTEYTADQIKNYYHRHRLNCGLTGRFEKGHITHNKGKHTKTTGRMAETQFKKGHIPKNHKPVGTESIRSNKGRKYIYVKVAEPKTWKSYIRVGET